MRTQTTVIIQVDKKITGKNRSKDKEYQTSKQNKKQGKEILLDLGYGLWEKVVKGALCMSVSYSKHTGISLVRQVYSH